MSCNSTRFAQSDAERATTQQAAAAGGAARRGRPGSDALYRLEKRLLERFPRERVYVRAFFLDVAPPRKKAPKGA